MMANCEESDFEEICTYKPKSEIIEPKEHELLTPNPIKDLSYIKEMFSELELDDTSSELFYNSIKIIFDTGFELAKSLNLELSMDLIDQQKKEFEESI